MDTPICIPSRGRFNLSRSTLRHFPQELWENTILFVPANEAVVYETCVMNCQFQGVRVHPCHNDGIAGVRHEIGMWAQHNGYDKFIMVDDDITQFSTRVDPELTNMRPSDHEDIIEMFETVEEYLNYYAHIGVSQRFHNDMYNGEGPIVVENTRNIRFMAYQTIPFLECVHGRVPVLEDFDITLQLLDKGFKNAVLHKWSQDQSETNSDGGCSTYRTLDFHNACVEEFAELWPDVVRIREKFNISQGAIDAGLAERLEVVISWQRAYKPKVEDETERAT